MKPANSLNAARHAPAAVAGCCFAATAAPPGQVEFDCAVPDARLGWRPNGNAKLPVRRQNALHPQHAGMIFLTMKQQNLRFEINAAVVHSPPRSEAR